MNRIKFTGSNGDPQFKDRICFQGAISDYTLCGITMDGDTETAGDYIGTKEKCNCRDCISIINLCKKIKRIEFI